MEATSALPVYMLRDVETYLPELGVFGHYGGYGCLPSGTPWCQEVYGWAYQ